MNTPFATLPVELQEKIKDALRAYDEVAVYFENGAYRFGYVIKAQYAPDHKFIGVYYASDVFTEQERMLNYVNEFQSYPINYKGKRNYTDFHTGKRETFVMNENGDIVIAKSA